MIKINLLGDDRKFDDSFRLMLLGYVASLLLLVGLLAIMQFMVVADLSAAVEEKASLDGQLARLKERTKEVRDLEKERDELKNVTVAVGRLKLGQSGPVRALDDLNLAVPDRVWLTEVNEKEGLAVVKGFALNDLLVSTFIKNLLTSSYFKVVELKESRTVSLVQVQAYNHYSSTFSRLVGAVEEVPRLMSILNTEARKAGLEFTQSEGPPNFAGSGEVSWSASGGAPTTGGTGFGRRRAPARKQMISAWRNLEPINAKQFTLEVKIEYAGKVLAEAAKTAAKTTTAKK